MSESKEQTHRRYYEAFHDWFMQSQCDFWNECDAPESLATIAVELQDASLAAVTRERDEAREALRALLDVPDLGFHGVGGEYDPDCFTCPAVRWAKAVLAALDATTAPAPDQGKPIEGEKTRC